MFDPRESNDSDSSSDDYRGDYETEQTGTFDSWSDYENAIEGTGDSGDSSESEE